MNVLRENVTVACQLGNSLL